MIRRSLYDKLKEISHSDYYPFHMPGHKRMMGHPFLDDFPNPYTLDITEIDGFDNLHHPEGILKDSMERTAAIYGADKSYYLVNGSTCGILSAICGTTRYKDRIIMGRNCHKSAYHGAFLNHLEITYLYPQINEKFGIQGGITAEELEDLLKTSYGVAAVFIVSPTYDGVVSDIKSLADICHAHGVPLIVDEAHGAHFRYGEIFPVSALDLGADVVIQSLHKTLPAFTQTALLHLKKGFIDIEKIEHYLQIFQSSSPSYVFLAGIERCIKFMETEGKQQITRFEDHLMKLRRHLMEMRYLKLLDRSVIGNHSIYDLDVSKIVVSTERVNLDGRQLMDRLRADFHLELEMCSVNYVTAITSMMDTQKGLERLEHALKTIDQEQLATINQKEQIRESTIWKGSTSTSGISLYEAWTREKKRVLLEESEGMICGEFVYLYPPGIPLVVPGEILTKERIRTIALYKQKGFSIQGLSDYDANWIQTV